MIYKTRQFGTKANAHNSGTSFWMPLKHCFPVSQKTHFNSQPCIAVPGELYCPDSLLAYFSAFKNTPSLSWQLCTRVVVQVVGAIEHNYSFNSDASCAGAC
jgi:hypothetical protein